MELSSRERDLEIDLALNGDGAFAILKASTLIF
jgi:hypothetical protein